MKYLLTLLFCLITSIASAFSSGFIQAITSSQTAGGGGTATNYSDNFNTDPLASRWSNLWGTSIWSGSTLFGATSPGSYAKYNTATGGVDQYCKFTITTGSSGGGCIFRSTGTASNGFYVGVVLGGGTVWFSRGNNTGWVADMTSISLAYAIGDTIAMTITGTGTGTTLRVWKNTTANIPDSVSSWDSSAAAVSRVASGGTYYDTGNYIGTGVDTTYYIDNWYGGSL